MKSPIKTIIFDDTPLDVRGIRDILKGIPEIVIVGVYDTIGDALSSCRELKPDLLIADADIRGDKTAGPIFVRSVLKILPNLPILGLTRWPDCLVALKRAGCKEVVLKQAFDNEQAALKFIRGTLVEPPYVVGDEPPQLTEEEDRILRMLANGRTENELILATGKTRKQVRNIKGALKNKFGAVSNHDTELVSLAYRRGYLRVDDDLSAF
jgi:DNA-binding NarL/FixJ family response regulator